ncbi:MAG: FMN-binding protein [Candidatus Peribacter sp.]|nr:FMN-binding protein [Candidatus Peribacter sp.]
MKKYFSSLLLILVFTAYATYRRMSDFGTTAPITFTPPSATNTPPSRRAWWDDDEEEYRPVVAPAVVPRPASIPSQPAGNPTAGRYRNGTYVGSSADAYFGNVQVQVVVQNGNVADVQLLDHPKDSSNSVKINMRAIPFLVQEAIQAQSAPVDIVSGATETSLAFNQSFANALAQANQ